MKQLTQLSFAFIFLSVIYSSPVFSCGDHSPLCKTICSTFSKPVIGIQLNPIYNIIDTKGKNLDEWIAYRHDILNYNPISTGLKTGINIQIPAKFIYLETGLQYFNQKYEFTQNVFPNLSEPNSAIIEDVHFANFGIPVGLSVILGELSNGGKVFAGGGAAFNFTKSTKINTEIRMPGKGVFGEAITDYNTEQVIGTEFFGSSKILMPFKNGNSMSIGLSYHLPYQKMPEISITRIVNNVTYSANIAPRVSYVSLDLNYWLTR